MSSATPSCDLTLSVLAGQVAWLILADTVAVVQRGDRVQPVAMRLDASGGRWAVTELRFWRCETDAGASPPRNRAAGW
jgi:hypothetical protein